jgi:hypothetical protein
LIDFGGHHVAAYSLSWQANWALFHSRLAIDDHTQASDYRDGDGATALLNNSPLLFLVGVIAVIPGLAMVLGHNVWSGRALPVSVTVIGSLTLIKGVLSLFLSPEAESGFFLGVLHYQQYFYLYVSTGLVLEIYLTWGSRSTRRQG